MRINELLIKVESLGLEQARIRKRERTLKRLARKARRRNRSDEELVKAFWSLRCHRGELRCEARSAQLARAFLRGRSYESCEKRARTAPNWERIWRIAQKFGRQGFDLGRWETWLAAAQLAFRVGQEALRLLELAKRARAEATTPEARAEARAARRQSLAQWEARRSRLAAGS